LSILNDSDFGNKPSHSSLGLAMTLKTENRINDTRVTLVKDAATCADGTQDLRRESWIGTIAMNVNMACCGVVICTQGLKKSSLAYCLKHEMMCIQPRVPEQTIRSNVDS